MRIMLGIRKRCNRGAEMRAILIKIPVFFACNVRIMWMRKANGEAPGAIIFATRQIV